MSATLYVNFPEITYGECKCFAIPKHIIGSGYCSDVSDGSVEIGNITGNLVEMCSHVPVKCRGDKVTLADAIWNVGKFAYMTNEVLDMYRQAKTFVLKNDEMLSQYNSENGWGTVGTLRDFLWHASEILEVFEGFPCQVVRC